MNKYARWLSPLHKIIFYFNFLSLWEILVACTISEQRAVWLMLVSCTFDRSITFSSLLWKNAVFPSPSIASGRVPTCGLLQHTVLLTPITALISCDSYFLFTCRSSPLGCEFLDVRGHILFVFLLIAPGSMLSTWGLSQ